MAAEDPRPPNGVPFLAGDETWTSKRNKWKNLKIPKTSVGSFLRRVLGLRRAPETISADNLNPLVLATEGQRLQTENEILQSQIGSLNESLMIAESKIEELEIQLEALRRNPRGQDYVLLQRQIADMQRNHEALLSRMQYAYKNKIIQQHNDYKHLYEQFGERMQELRELTELHQESANQIMQLRQENSVLVSQRDHLVEDVEKLQDELYQSRIELGEAREENGRLASERDHLAMDVERLQEELRQSKFNLGQVRALVERLEMIIQDLLKRDKVCSLSSSFVFVFLQQ